MAGLYARNRWASMAFIAWVPVAIAQTQLPSPVLNRAVSQSASQSNPLPSATWVEAGARWYQYGVDAGGRELQASVGASTALPGALAACARCHGSTGRGSRDAGLAVPALTWSVLTQERLARGGDFARPAYTEDTLVRALREGVDAGGRPLASAMPRFALNPRQAAELLVYLKALGTPQAPVPGVHPQALSLVTLTPRAWRNTPAGQAQREAVQACLDRANRQGGVHGRQLQVRVEDSETVDGVLPPPWRDDAFAVVAPWWPRETAAVLAQRLGPVPVVGPLGAAAELQGAGNWWFGVSAAPSEQLRIAVDRIAQQTGSRRLHLVLDAVAQSWGIDQAVQAQAHLHGMDLQVHVWPSQAAFDWVGAHSSEPVLAPLDGAGLSALLDRLPAARPVATGALAPRVWALAERAGPSGAASHRTVEWIGSVLQPEEASPELLLDDLRAAGFQAKLPALQAPAYAASCTLVEGLRRAGAALDRERLVAALSGLHSYSAGPWPSLSYGPQQRQGLARARVLQWEADTGGFRAIGPWLTARSHPWQTTASLDERPSSAPTP